MRINDIIHLKHLELCLTHNQPVINLVILIPELFIFDLGRDVLVAYGSIPNAMLLALVDPYIMMHHYLNKSDYFSSSPHLPYTKDTRFDNLTYKSKYSSLHALCMSTYPKDQILWLQMTENKPIITNILFGFENLSYFQYFHDFKK